MTARGAKVGEKERARLSDISKPKPDDPRRCQARKNQGFLHLPREQRPLKCRKFALVGTQYCQFHSGSRVRVKVNSMPRVYRKMGKSLLARLEEIEAGGQEMLQLRDELNLQRVVADESVMMYSIALDLKEKAEAEHAESPSDEGLAVKVIKARQLHDQAAATLNSSLKNVRETCLDAAKVESLTSGKFSAETVRSIVFKMMKIMSDVCGPEHEDLAAEFAERVETQIKVRDEAAGTNSTPDEDVAEMDDTVPRA